MIGEEAVTTLSAKDARQNFNALISSVARGKTVTITRRGKAVAKVSPASKPGSAGLPDLSDFRAKLKKTEGKSATIEDLRRNERY